MFEELAHSGFASLLGLLEIISTASTTKLASEAWLILVGFCLVVCLLWRIVAAERRK